MRNKLVAAVALACLLPPVASPAHATLFLEELTSPEVLTAIKGGKATILVPIGGTEQNGDHIVLGKHNTRARILAEDIAQRLGSALVAPVIAYVPEGSIDPPSGHMRAPGTITVPVEAFERALESAARSFLKHGFSAVVLLGDHGGYQASLRRVAERMNRRGGRPVVVVPKEYYREMEHAGMDDTALTLAIDPRLVREPRGATAEKGRAMRKDIVERTARAVETALAR